MSTESPREIRELTRKSSELAHRRDLEDGHAFPRAGVRPAPPLICQFITDQRDRFGVPPICRALSAHGVPIAPRTSWAYIARRVGEEGPHPQRQGIPVARSTVARLMRRNDWRGATRARTVRAAILDPAATRAPDLLNRNVHAARPSQRPTADFTSVFMVTASGSTALAVDALAGLIAGWDRATATETVARPRAGTTSPPVVSECCSGLASFA